MHYYRFACGCVVPYTDCKHRGEYNRTFICSNPEHKDQGGRVRKGVVFKCDMCGKQEDLLKPNPHKKYCAECRQKKNKEQKKKSNLLNRRRTYQVNPLEIDSFHGTPSKWDCRWYQKCLRDHCGSYRCKKLPCEKCIRYEKTEIDIMDYARYDSSCDLSMTIESGM